MQRRSRNHETLVNSFAKWLEERGLEVGRNAAIDLGLESPQVIVEAKWVTSWPKAIREAVGQLHEYRHFRVAAPNSGLVFLASHPVPEIWTEYLESDRHIGVAWRDGTDFHLLPLARSILGLS